MNVGDIYRHDRFYPDPATGELLPKYLVILTRLASGDLVARLLTSRPHRRPESPPCFHGTPYPGYFLGVLGGPLAAKSWVDLRRFRDLDEVDFRRELRAGVLSLAGSVPVTDLRPLLECAAAAEDTTRLQEWAIRDQLQQLD
jgi:hypothetical protein